MWTTDEEIAAAVRPDERRTRAGLAVALWLLLLGASFAIDRPVAGYFHEHHWPQWLAETHLADVLKFPGEYWFTLTASILVIVFSMPTGRWPDGLFVACSGFVTGFNGLV